MSKSVDRRITVEDIVAEEDKVVVRVLLKGTHTGDNFRIPTAGRRVRAAGIVLVRIANGQIVDDWNSYDKLGLLSQIGASPSAEGPDRFFTGEQ